MKGNSRRHGGGVVRISISVEFLFMEKTGVFSNCVSVEGVEVLGGVSEGSMGMKRKEKRKYSCNGKERSENEGKRYYTNL